MKVIPITKLRHFYKSLAELRLSTETQLSIIKDFNRKENYKILISWYNKSKEHFGNKYENIKEDFFPDSMAHRKCIPNNATTISSTTDVISVFQNKNPEIDVDNSEFKFKYLEREVNWYSDCGHLEKIVIKNKLWEVSDDSKAKELYETI